MIYELPEEQQGPELPATLPEAIAALQVDEVLKEGLGQELIDAFLTIKSAELDRYRKWVSDWEFAEYSHHL